MICGLVACGGSALAAKPRQVRLGTAPATPHSATVMGALPDTTDLSTLVELKPSDPLALSEYAQGVSTPSSPDYHQYLTLDQFRQRFGATASTVSAVESDLQAAGLNPGPPNADGLFIPVHASAGALAQAFDTSFERVQLASGRVAYANMSAPALPQNVSAQVQGVAGLSSLVLPQSQAKPLAQARRRARAGHVTPHVITGGPQPCAAASGVPDGTSTGDAYTADEIASAYGFGNFYSPGDLGAGQTIALLELEPNLDSDVTAYANCYTQNGSPLNQTISYPIQNGNSAGSSPEADLDIEQVMALAPGAAINIFQLPNTITNYLDLMAAAVNDTSNDEISTSWGECEPENGTALPESYIFEQAAVQGQSVYAAAGDTGSSDCYVNGASNPNTTLAVDDPGSQPYVTSVGGTTLSNYTAPQTQGVWNNTTGAGGGGISTFWDMPTWQANAPSALNVINANSSATPCGNSAGSYCREVPDVVADADPNTGYPIYWTNPSGSGITRCSTYPWCAFGGTSAAAPFWAAYTALVNASSNCNNQPIGFANPLLYQAAGSAAYASDFTDVQTGNNDYRSLHGGLYPAGAGYDMATGLGAPVGPPLAATLCAESDVITLTNPGNQSGQVGAIAQLTLSATDRQSHTGTAYTVQGLPPGLTYSSSTGTISGTETTAGSYTVTATATAGTSGAVSTPQTFTWVVAPTNTPAQTVTQTNTITTPAQTITQTNTVTQPAQTVTAPTQTVIQVNTQTVPGPTQTVPGPTQTLTTTRTVTQPAVTTTITTPTRTVTIAAKTQPVTKTQTLTTRYGNQLLKLTLPLPSGCLAPSASYQVSFSTTAGSGSPKLKFKSIAYYFDKLTARSASSTKASSTIKLKLGALKAGSHTLRAIASYADGGHTVTKPLTAKLKLCS